MELIDILKKAKTHKASDIHLVVGAPPKLRVNGGLAGLKEDALSPSQIEKYAEQIVSSAEQLEKLRESGELDLAYTTSETGRYRVNVFKQKDFYSIVLRTINTEIPSFDALRIPDSVRELYKKKRGLILVTGPTGSGKSTTLAALVNKINVSRADNIITLEDPIEYLHTHKASVINQREIGRDSMNYGNALRAALREDPNVILIGEMRDLETIETAVTAAETGHLVLSTLHTTGAANSIDRIIGVFPPHHQQQIRMQLSNVLEAVVSQQLVPDINKSERVAAFEVMIAVPAIRNLIREGKIFQINSTIQTGSKDGMVMMDDSLKNLYYEGKISRQTALDFSMSPSGFLNSIK